MTTPAQNAESVRKVQAEKREWIRAHKARLGCDHCPENDPICLDLHHRDPRTKNPRLRGQVRGTFANLGWDELQVEVFKCRVLCANCHRKLHAREAKAGKHNRSARSRRLRAIIENIGS